MKKTVCFLLVTALAACFGGCGKNSSREQVSEPAIPNASQSVVAENDTTHAGALPVEDNMDNYVLNYDYVSVVDTDRTVLEGYGMDTADENAPIADLDVQLADLQKGRTYSFILRSVVGKNYANNAGYKASMWLYAHCEGLFLFSVNAYPGDEECYYFYNAETGELKTVGLRGLIRLLGNYILLQPVFEEGKTAAPLEFYNWKGELVSSVENVRDLTKSNEDLYLLTESPDRLLRVSQDAFYAEKPDFTGEVIAETGEYDAMFGIFDVDTIAFTRKDKAHFFTCPISEAAARLAAYTAAPADTPEPPTEACALFSVTLPGFWAGHYDCELSEDAMLFSHVAADGVKNELFSILLIPVEQTVEYVGGGTFLNRYINGDELRLTLVAPNQSYQDVDTEEDLYAAMLNSLEDVCASMKAVPAGAYFEDFDYGAMRKTFTGEAENGVSFTVSLHSLQRNVLTGEITAKTAAKENQAEVYIVMLDTAGYLIWSKGPETRGDGVAVWENGALTIDIEDAENGFDTGGEIILK